MDATNASSFPELVTVCDPNVSVPAKLPVAKTVPLSDTVIFSIESSVDALPPEIPQSNAPLLKTFITCMSFPPLEVKLMLWALTEPEK